MNLTEINKIDIKNKKILLRADLDVAFEDGKCIDSYRLEALIPTLEVLSENNCEVTIIGHRGRPDGTNNQDLSLKQVSRELENILKKKWGENKVSNLRMQMMENLRFDKGEEENDERYAKELSDKGEIYVNDAFAVSHRKHASIVSLPKFMPSAFGVRFIEEVKNLSKLIDNPQKPVVAVIGGIKNDKAEAIEGISSVADKILVGGRLPMFFGDDDRVSIKLTKDDEIALYANLLPDKEDITIASIEKFENEISKAKTILVAGPMGRYEEDGHSQGTKRVFEAVAKTDAFKIAGGGDTISALRKFNLLSKFEWISVGGGSMIEFLINKTLPGIEAQSR